MDISKKKITYYRKYTDGDDYIYIKFIDDKNKLIEKKFIADDNIKRISNFNTQTRANEKILLKYFQKISGEEYKPTPKGDFIPRVEKLIKKNDNKNFIKHIKKFKNENRVIYSNKIIPNVNFKHSYIVVNVRIYLDGYYVNNMGRSDLIPKQIPPDLRSILISQAIKRAIAPFGSNVKYTLLSWSYGYYQKKYQHFN